MSRTLHLVLLAAVAASGCGIRTSSDPRPSRMPANGCAWEDYTDAKRGFSVLVQKCTDGKSGIDQVEKMIEVFDKPAQQPLDQAIRERFFNSLSDEEHAGCTAQKSERLLLPDPIVTMEITPRGGYLLEVKKKREADPEFRACGDHGQGKTLAYFEYHPNETLTKYLFVRLGKDRPLFDEMSIRLR